MKSRYILMMLCCLSAILGSAQNSLFGVVTDASTGQTVPGAVVYIPMLKIGTTTDSTGHYTLMQIAKGTYDIQVELLGYTTLIKHVTISGSQTLNFSLEESTSDKQEVVITALGNITTSKRTPTPVDLVTHQALLETTSTNVVDGIATRPGVTAITTGPGVSKPEIRGLGFSRVLTLYDGVRQEDFQWGDEHGIQIDANAVYDVEIVRGPASLQYGSDAMGGVVSFSSAPFPEMEAVKGSVLTQYQTNNGLMATSVDASGNNNGFVWDARGSYGQAHCYWDPKDGYVWGTAYREEDGQATFGVNKSWGYSHVTVSALHRTIEIPDGNRDSATSKFKFDFPINGQLYPNNSNYLSYNPTYVGYQQIEHDAVSWQTSVNVGKGRILADVSYSQDHREEIDTGTVPLLNMYMHSIPYSVKYQIAGDSNGLKFTGGINGMAQGMYNASEAPDPYVSVFLVPNYNLFDVGGFGILEKDYKYLTLSGGLRYDIRNESTESLYLLNQGKPGQTEVSAGTTGAYTNFQGFNNTYSGFSGCFGASYELPANYYVKANVSRSYRAPAITEIGENGVHPGTFNYEIGDPTLKPEQGNEIDVTFGKSGRSIDYEVDGFYNNITNFIFASRIEGKNGGDSITQGYPTLKFQATDAIIEGVEAYFNIHPTTLRWLELDNGFTYIYTLFPGHSDSTQHVPFTPAPRLTSELKLKLRNRHSSILRNTYFKFGVAYYWAQNNVYSANYTELPSVAYGLFNAGIGTSFVNPKTLRTICMLYINITNLTNLAYYDHTSRPQYFLSYNGVTPVQVTNPVQGIYNMGRNVGFKLVFPFGSSVSSPSHAVFDEY